MSDTRGIFSHSLKDSCSHSWSNIKPVCSQCSLIVIACNLATKLLNIFPLEFRVVVLEFPCLSVGEMLFLKSYSTIFITGQCVWYPAHVIGITRKGSPLHKNSHNTLDSSLGVRKCKQTLVNSFRPAEKLYFLMFSVFNTVFAHLMLFWIIIFHIFCLYWIIVLDKFESAILVILLWEILILSLSLSKRNNTTFVFVP